MTLKPFRPEFRVRLDGSLSPGSRSIKVEGELDSGTSEPLVEAFESTFADPGLGELVLDLSEVSFIDSAGMRTIIMLQRAAGEREVRLVMMPPPERVTELLRIAGVADRVSLVFPGPGARPVAHEFSDRVELELPCDSLAPARARAEMREMLADSVGEDEMANLVLLTSEVVTNAVIHARSSDGTPIGLCISTYDGGVRVEVDDGGGGFDPASPASSTSGGGQGLFLVEHCSARWGVNRVHTSRGAAFRVWFEFEPAGSGSLASAPD